MLIKVGDKMAVNAGNVYSELILNGDKYFKTLEKADKDMKAFENKLNNYGKSMEKVGSKLTKTVSVPIAGLGVMATKASIDFETAFAGVRKTVDASEEQFAKLEKGIIDMSKEIPASATAISEVAEAAGQLGIETENILGFTRVMIDLGESTNMSADEAATALARLANITGMSQTDFDRLGSTIVDLGNNLATTEAEIVNMGLRLAGAGSQIGLTEAQIMSFAGALSSVGIEAEAGGSAFSKVMIDMQLAVETNSERLKEFADVAGMSAEEFRKAFQEDAAGAIIAFIQGLGTAEERGLSAIKVLDDMGISEVRLRDALLRASGASDVFTQSLKIGTNAWEENTALTKEAEQRYKTTASQIEIAKNYLKDAGITIGEIVVPHLVSLAEKAKQVSEWFSKLNPETQETIVKMAGLAAATGPVLSIGGKLARGTSSIISLFGKLSLGTTAATTTVASLGNASAIGATKVGGLGLAAKASTLLLNPWTAAIAAGGLAAYGLYKNLSEDAIPAIDLFGDSVSENTQKAVSGFLELDEQASMALKQMSWSGQEVTEEMAESIIGNFEEMKEQVVGKLEEQKEGALKSISEMVEKSIDMTEEEKEEMIRITGESYDEQIKKTEEGNARIKEILETAKKENRAITEEEKNEINKIKEDMKNDGIRILSESEKEQLAIMERLKQESGKISARQAAEIVKKSKEQKEKTIAEAEEEYTERLKYAAQLRADGSEESERLADKVVEEAERQKNEATKKAEEMHENVITEAKAQAEEHVNQVDWETGEIKTKWQVMKDDIQTKAKEIKEDVISRWEEIKTSTSEKWNDIKTDVSNSWSDMKRETFEKVKDIWSEMTSRWEEIYISTKENWRGIKTSVANNINNIKDKIDEGIEKIEEWNRTHVKEKIFKITEKIRRVFSCASSGVGYSDSTGSTGNNAHGTNFWRGGLTWVGEQGPELIDLPKGTKVYSNQKSMEMVRGASGGIIQNIHIHSPEPLSPSEVARKNLQVSRQLAMEWGV